MSLSREFLDRYVEVQLECGRNRVHQAAVDLGLWRGFVTTCESGYDDSLYEYHFDLQVRDAIEAALNDRELSRLDGYDLFHAKVSVIDEKFRQIATVPLPVKDRTNRAWWNLAVPHQGCKEFAENLREEFGVTITVAPESDD